VERLRYLARPDFRGTRVVVLEDGTEEDGESGSEVRGSVSLDSLGPGSYALQADCDAAAWLVLAEAWYPGWTVEVDGHPDELRRVDQLLQAVRLAPGRHEVRFRYRARFLVAGLAVAALAALVPLGILARRRLLKPRA